MRFQIFTFIQNFNLSKSNSELILNTYLRVLCGSVLKGSLYSKIKAITKRLLIYYLTHRLMAVYQNYKMWLGVLFQL